MRVLLIEMGRAFLVWWGKTWRLVIRSRRNFFVFLGLVVGVFIVWNFGSLIVNPPPPRAATVTESAAPTVEYAEVTAVPIGPGQGTTAAPQGDSQAPVAAEGTNAGAVTPQGYVEPTSPSVDAQSQDSVTKGFMSAFMDRPSNDWKNWEPWVKDYATSELVYQLAKSDPLADSTLNFPVRVKSVEISPAKEGAAMDTPVRWSRTATVAVEAESGETDSLVFAVMLAQGENGWVVTEAVREAK